jgi:hypothetical protein
MFIYLGYSLGRLPVYNTDRLPHIPLVDDPPISLDASLPVPPRRPHNMARKRVAKKLKVTETTAHEVSFSSSVVEYLSWSLAC